MAAAADPRFAAALPAIAPRRLGRRAEATVGAIVACLVPAYPEVDPTVRAGVLADVTRFVGSQIAALPDFLRFPYGAALTAFELLPLLRWGRSFSALDAARRRAWVDLWTDAKIGAMRNFVKLIRGCALLAYYDHPALAASLRAATDDTPSFLRPAAGRAHD
jgi:hypothetical protein